MRNNKFKIDKDIPIPNPIVNWKEFPFDEMEVGDSFFVKKSTYKHVTLIRLRGFLFERAKRFIIDECSLFKFSFVTERQNDGVRVFRVE